MIDPDQSTPIDECLKHCTADERKAIAAREPPYDGVRTWGDLVNVRGQQKGKASETSRNTE